MIQLHVVSATYNENIPTEQWINQITTILNRESHALDRCIERDDIKVIKIIFAILEAIQETALNRFLMRRLDFKSRHCAAVMRLIRAPLRQCHRYYQQRELPIPSDNDLLTTLDGLLLQCY